MSTADRIRSIIDTTKRTQERLRAIRERRVAKESAALMRSSREGAAWLGAHVVPVLLELRRAVNPEQIIVDIEENLAPAEHLPARHFAGPSVALRLRDKNGPSGSAPVGYVFHCDGEFLNVGRIDSAGSRPVGMPFEIESNPQEAKDIVFEIVRHALDDYYHEHAS